MSSPVLSGIIDLDGTSHMVFYDTSRRYPWFARAGGNELQAANHEALLEMLRQITSQRRFTEEPPIGQVLVFRHEYHGQDYGYAALRAADGKWYLTGRETRGMRWEDLVRFIGPTKGCSIATGWKDVPAVPGAAEPVTGLGGRLTAAGVRHPRYFSEPPDDW